MLFIFLALLLCSQYAASVPVGTLDPGLRLHLTPASWAAANVICQLEGGFLASPTTSASAQVMQATIAKHTLSSVFIGMSDWGSKGNYKSLDGSAFTDMPLEWAAGEPNNVGNIERCLELTSAGTLNDVPCLNKYPYFCRVGALHNVNSNGDCAQPEVPPCNGKIGYVYEPRTGSCYKFHAAAQAWRPAWKTCLAEGADLAIINNQAESTVLKEIHNKNKNDITQAIDSNYISIGFMKLDDDEWVTVHGESLSEAGFSEWSSGEPSNGAGGEHCGSIYKDGLLNDTMCKHKLAFICEITPFYTI